MSSDVERHVIERIVDSPLRPQPFPHFYVEGIFPEDYYEKLRNNLPANENYLALGDTGRVLKGAYKERFVFTLDESSLAALPEDKQAFWRDMSAWILGRAMCHALCQKFAPAIARRFGEQADKVALGAEALVVRDKRNYSIGPHTDAPHRFLSLLFYCPPDDSMAHLGTSLYQPIDRSFRCPGGPHHAFDKFVNVGTMGYRRNSLFGFLKTDDSFHGVEPIKDEAIERDLILYDIRVCNLDELGLR